MPSHEHKEWTRKTGHWERGTQVGANWEIDFMEVKPGLYGYEYLLVFIDTFPGWTEVLSLGLLFYSIGLHMFRVSTILFLLL